MRSTYDVKEEYTGTGALADYTFSFKIEALAQLEVIELDDSGVETQRVRGTDAVYLSSVDFDAVDGGGTVHLAANLTNNYKLILLLANDAPTQTYEFKNKGDFTLPRIERALDLVLGPVQRLTYLVARSIRLHDREDVTAYDLKLPEPAAYESFRWNSLVTAWEAVKVLILASGSSVNDNRLVRWDGTTGTQVQNSVVELTDAGAMSGVTQLDVDNVRVDGNTISSTNTNGNLNLEPNGTGATTTTKAVHIGSAASPHASAILDLESTSKGLLPPRMTTAERTAIGTPATGLVVFDTTLGTLMWYDGATWLTLASNDVASTPILNGNDTVVVVLGVPFADANYRVSASIRNVTDTDPQFLQFVITAQNATGFTAKLNAATDSGNYTFDYIAVKDT